MLIDSLATDARMMLAPTAASGYLLKELKVKLFVSSSISLPLYLGW
jgi:hypothetical protein